MTNETNNVVENKAVENLQNLLGFLTTSAKFANDSIACCMIEVALKLQFFNVKSSNWKAVLGADTFKSANKAFNAERMTAFGAKLLGNVQQKQLFMHDWKLSKKNQKQYCVIGGIYRVQDDSTTETRKFTARYSETYNTVFHVIKYWLAQDAVGCLKAVYSEKPNVEKFLEMKLKYQETVSAEAEAKAAKKQDTGLTIPANMSEEYLEMHNRALSVLRMAQALDENIVGTGVYDELNDSFDSMIDLLKDVAAKLPDSEDTEEAMAAEADKVASKAG